MNRDPEEIVKDVLCPCIVVETRMNNSLLLLQEDVLFPLNAVKEDPGEIIDNLLIVKEFARDQ